ncbi:MAG TPA: penicillin-binding protein 2 [Streptosporangiaceae bacterium]|nr:penicillin-binding protein 2 [Streptosporangiaceae bacterium]
MNRSLRRLSIACLAMFVLLLAWVNYLQVFRVNSLASEPGNSRIFNEQFKNQRGEIIAAGGRQDQVIAESKLVKGGVYQRFYPDPMAYAPITGYDSVLGTTSPFGLTGIEYAENKYLAGSASNLAVYNLKGLFTGHSRQGASVYLTIDPKAQAAAYDALAAKGIPAAAVAINPSTGAILALASYPTFNPNRYATQDTNQLAKIDARYRHDPSRPLDNRALNDTFPPGSTFKIITSSAGFGTGRVGSATSTIPAPQFYRLPGSTHVLTNDGDAPCGDGHPQIIFAFTLSCNTAFGKLGATLGGQTLVSYAQMFGFNNFGQGASAPPLTIPLPVTPSAIPPGLKDPAETANSAIGQFDDAVTPLQEAMMAATVANHGVLMRPYLVQEIRAPDQEVVQDTQPVQIRRVISSKVAGYLTAMMESVTHNPSGTAYFTASPSATGGLDIAGKTGTAQNGRNNTNLNDAVFTCFAPGSSPQIAVAVIVKGGGFGAAAAAPIAVKIIQAYLGQH